MATAFLWVTVGSVLLSGVHCVQWASSLEDGAMLYVCEGQDLTLPWHFTPDTGEHIIDIEWLFSGLSEQMIAMYSHNSFLPTPSYAQRVTHLADAGLVLSHVTPGDAGNYTVAVNTDRSGGTPYRLSALVHVASAATARTDATLDARQEPRAVYDNQTGQYHVQLTCTSHGRQPPAVTWTTPSQQTINVSEKNGNHFSLMLPNPVSGGNYTCRIPPDSPAASCLPKDDPALEGATVFVDKMDARLMLVEAEQSALRRENDNLKAKNLDLEHRVLTLETFHAVVFHAYPRTNFEVPGGAHVIFNGVSINTGNGYSTSTGEFTAPYDGAYFFTATSGGYMNDESNLYLMVDDFSVSRIKAKSVHPNFDQGTISYAGHLTSGQRVWLKSYRNSSFLGSVASFTGFLVSAYK